MITGGFGFVGRHLTRMLLEKGDKVTIFDVVTGSEFLNDVMDKLTVKVGDLSNWVHVAETVKDNKIDTIYHVGAAIPPSSENNPSAAFYANIVGTFNILEAARIFGVGSVIFTSTQSSYQEGDYLIPDNFPQRPDTFYGMTKVCGERLGEAYWRRYGLNFRGVRYCIVNGPGRGGINPGQFVVWTLQMAALNRPFKVFVEPDTKASTIYVMDAAKALIDLNNAEESKLTRRVYSIVGYSITAQQLVEGIKKYLPNAKLTFRVNKEMMQKVRDLNLERTMDISPAQNDWGFEPEFDLGRTIQDYINECTKNRHLLDYQIPEF